MNDEQFIEKLSTVIREERRKQNLSQDKLAWKSDVPKPTIQDIEYGKRKNPGVVTLLKIAKGLGLSYSKFFKVLE